jgi:DNA repair photolyase
MKLKVVYEPSGRAREYAPLAFNPWIGCTGGCRYCYAKHMARKTAVDFHKVPTPKDKLAAFEADCKALRDAGDDRIIFLSFMCDPFQRFPDHEKDWESLIYHYINIAVLYGRKVRTLTKVPRNVDWRRLSTVDFGVTLSGETDTPLESGTDLQSDRIKALRIAKAKGHTTWVSMEPVINPDMCLLMLESFGPEVDFWRIGKLNARSADMKAIERSIDWKAFGEEVRRILPEGKYMLKEDLLKEMGE